MDKKRSKVAMRNYLEDIALTMTPGIGAKGAVHLLEVFGSARAIFEAGEEELIRRAELNPRLAEGLLKRVAFRDAEREIRHCERHAIQIIASTDPGYPRLLRETPDYPHVLYFKGNAEVLRQPALAVVGTRQATHYGQTVTVRLIKHLAERKKDLTIVSGLAYGIDGWAHRAAIGGGLKTIAVVANALPAITPADHTGLAREIVEEGGVVLTELHSQTKQNGRLYPSRNRIIAGIAAGCLVIESGAHGGSLDTAQRADGYHRTLMAVPGRITDPNSAGTNHLIAKQLARPIFSGEDILRELMWDLDCPPILPKEKPRTPDLTEDEEGLLGCFRTSDPLTTDELIELTGLDTSYLTILLMGLELSGFIRQLPGNRFVKQ